MDAGKPEEEWTESDWALSRCEPREDQHDGVVVLCGARWAGNQHEEGVSGEFQAVRSWRWDAQHGREDDVRPEAEGDGQADLRRAEEAGHVAEVHAAASRDGLQQM